MSCKILPLLILAFAVVYVQAHDPQITPAMTTNIMENETRMVGELMNKMNVFVKIFETIIKIISDIFCKSLSSQIGEAINLIIKPIKTIMGYVTGTAKCMLELMMHLPMLFIKMMMSLKKHGINFDINLIRKLVQALSATELGSHGKMMIDMLSGLGGGMLGGLGGGSSDVSAGVHPGY